MSKITPVKTEIDHTSDEIELPIAASKLFKYFVAISKQSILTYNISATTKRTLVMADSLDSQLQFASKSLKRIIRMANEEIVWKHGKIIGILVFFVLE